MHILPVGVRHNVVGHIGVEDAHIVTGDPGGVGGLQHGRHLLHHVHGEDAGLVQAAAVGDGGGLAVGGCLGAVIHIGAGLEHVSRNGVQGQPCLTAHGLGGLQHVVVDGGQVQHIGQTHKVAVLVHLRLQGGGAELPALRGHALGQGLQRLGKGGVPAELDPLASVSGDGPLLAELAVDEVGLGLLDQRPVVKSLVLRREPGVRGDVHRGVVREQLHILHFHDVLLSKFLAFPWGKVAPLSPDEGRCELGSICRPTPVRAAPCHPLLGEGFYPKLIFSPRSTFLQASNISFLVIWATREPGTAAVPPETPFSEGRCWANRRFSASFRSTVCAA